MIPTDVARLTGALTVVAQGAATLVLGVETTALRVAVAVVFFAVGAAAVANRDVSVSVAGVAAFVALGWTAYVAYVTEAGVEAVVYEFPLLAVVGAALLVYPSFAEGSEVE